MLQTLFVLPLAQSFVPATVPDGGGGVSASALPIALFGLVLLVVLVLLLRRRARVVPTARQAILIDGSNVIHWQDNTPNLAPLRDLLRDLSRKGLNPGFVFDANVGYKLTGSVMDERALAQHLTLPTEQIFVVPKGTQADHYLLETARDLQAQIVTNDRFRDWVEDYPEVTRPGRLIRGGVRNGQIWVEDVVTDADPPRL